MVGYETRNVRPGETEKRNAQRARVTTRRRLGVEFSALTTDRSATQFSTTNTVLMCGIVFGARRVGTLILDPRKEGVSSNVASRGAAPFAAPFAAPRLSSQIKVFLQDWCRKFGIRLPIFLWC